MWVLWGMTGARRWWGSGERRLDPRQGAGERVDFGPGEIGQQPGEPVAQQRLR